MEKEKFIILSAEDDPDDRVFLREAIETIDRSFYLQFVCNGQELLDYLNENLPRLILLDLNMPVMDGREALRRIKGDADFKNIPAIIFTTSSEEEDRQACRALGAEDFVTKPPSFDDMVNALQGIIAKWLLDPMAA